VTAVTGYSSSSSLFFGRAACPCIFWTTSDEVAHTSLLIGQASLLFVDWTAYAVVRRPPKLPRSRGAFCAACIASYLPRLTGRGAMQKAPSRITGPFGRSSVGGECSSDPADFSIRHALIWFQGRPVACRVAYPRSCASSCLTSKARCGGMGVAKASYWSLRHCPIADSPTRLSRAEFNLL
jgi:hypothetical protein